jgi:hypothetical protein
MDPKSFYDEVNKQMGFDSLDIMGSFGENQVEHPSVEVPDMTKRLIASVNPTRTKNFVKIAPRESKPINFSDYIGGFGAMQLTYLDKDFIKTSLEDGIFIEKATSVNELILSTFRRRYKYKKVSTREEALSKYLSYYYHKGISPDCVMLIAKDKDFLTLASRYRLAKADYVEWCSKLPVEKRELFEKYSVDADIYEPLCRLLLEDCPESVFKYYAKNSDDALEAFIATKASGDFDKDEFDENLSDVSTYLKKIKLRKQNKDKLKELISNSKDSSVDKLPQTIIEFLLTLDSKIDYVVSYALAGVELESLQQIAKEENRQFFELRKDTTLKQEIASADTFIHGIVNYVCKSGGLSLDGLDSYIAVSVAYCSITTAMTDKEICTMIVCTSQSKLLQDLARRNLLGSINYVVLKSLEAAVGQIQDAKENFNKIMIVTETTSVTLSVLKYLNFETSFRYWLSSLANAKRPIFAVYANKTIVICWDQSFTDSNKTSQRTDIRSSESFLKCSLERFQNVSGVTLTADAVINYCSTALTHTVGDDKKQSVVVLDGGKDMANPIQTLMVDLFESFILSSKEMYEILDPSVLQSAFSSMFPFVLYDNKLMFLISVFKKLFYDCKGINVNLTSSYNSKTKVDIKQIVFKYYGQHISGSPSTILSKIGFLVSKIKENEAVYPNIDVSADTITVG